MRPSSVSKPSLLSSVPQPIENRLPPPDLALVLGSGLGAVAERMSELRRIPFQDIPGFEAAAVPGHKGVVSWGVWAGERVLVFEGRCHFYEGHSWSTVVRPIMLAADLGARVLLTTNAAGGIRPDLEPGQLLILTDHIDWTCPFAWRQATQRSPYSPRLIHLLMQAGAQIGMDVRAGKYAQVTGPCYETPAEIRALRAVGADAVGMSTAREIMAGAERGMACAAVSCITNRAAGRGSGPLNHQEVLATAARQRERLGDLIEAFVQLL